MRNHKKPIPYYPVDKMLNYEDCLDYLCHKYPDSVPDNLDEYTIHCLIALNEYLNDDFFSEGCVRHIPCPGHEAYIEVNSTVRQGMKMWYNTFGDHVYKDNCYIKVWVDI